VRPEASRLFDSPNTFSSPKWSVGRQKGWTGGSGVAERHDAIILREVSLLPCEDTNRVKSTPASHKDIDTQEGGKLDFDLPLRCPERRLGRTRNLASFLVIVQI
jgi:hypothetical protein